jgi:murein L,D-transpeptidase YcbB/YkuD
MLLDCRAARALLLVGLALLIPSGAAISQDAVVPSAAPAFEDSAVVPEAVAAAPAPAAPVSMHPLSVALRAAGLDDPAVEAFYAARGHMPFWLGPDRGWTGALLASLRDQPRHGLPDAAAEIARLEALAAGPAEPDAEAAVMAAYLDFARRFSSGLLEPGEIDREIFIEPLRPAAGALVARLAGAAPQDFSALAPPIPEYAALVAELGRLGTILEAEAAGGLVPPGPSLRPGDRSERVAALRSRIVALGAVGLTGLSPDEGATLTASAAPDLYDEALVAAVTRFQEERGLNTDGVVGRRTLELLNSPATAKYGQVLVNLERIRWLHRDLQERHIFVNQADFRMELVEADRVLLESRVVIGKTPATRTPEFIEMMDHLVVNPTWHVPRSIATKEMLPKLQADPTYLERNGYRISPIGEEPVPDGVTSDYSQFSTSYFPFRIRQAPGEGNALGKVKFMFPNQHAIYLHDTPLKKLFERDVRTFSHGCVRVQKAFDLAYALLEGQVEDPVASFERWLSTGRERRIDLDRPVRVYLTYRTVWQDRDGAIQYRADVYGRDARVLAALAEAGVATVR